jgi:KDO2-lipid IV(A) lauroyltransferase
VLAGLRWGVGVRLGAFAGGVAGSLARRKTRRIDANLEVLGRTRPEPFRGLAWRHGGETVAEMLWCLSRPSETILRRVEVSGLDCLVNAAAEGRGVLLVSAHVGNWELVSLVAARAALPVAVVARYLETPGLERRLHAFRQRCGVQTLVRHREGTSVSAYRWLRRGGVLGCMMDRAIGNARLRVPFLGQSASLPLGPMRLAAKTGAAVITGFARRRVDGRTEVAFARLVEAEGIRDPVVSCRIVGRALEAEIRSRPEHWLCLHRRRPPWDGQPST